MSRDGSIVGVIEEVDGRSILRAGIADASEVLPVRAAVAGTVAWWKLKSGGDGAYAILSTGELVELPNDGSVRGIANVGSAFKWIEPLLDEGAIIVATPQKPHGIVVETWGLRAGEKRALYHSDVVDDVVLGRDLKPRLFFSTTVSSTGLGFTQTMVQLMSRSGTPVGRPFAQFPWVIDAEPTPRITDAKVHMLGVVDTMGLGLVSDNGWTPVLSSNRGDATRLFRGVDGEVEGIGVESARVEWLNVGGGASPIAALSSRLGLDLRVVDRSSTDRYWIVGAWSASTLPRYYRWDRRTNTLLRFGQRWGQLEDIEWARVEPLALTAPDGLTVTAYLTTPDPKRFGERMLPLVVEVHGGPWAGRHSWIWDSRAQKNADQGWATLAVNFRGSRGFGWAFTKAGDLDDVTLGDISTAIRFVVEQRGVDPTKIAVTGKSFGGWAALMFATGADPAIRCAVSRFGLTDLTHPNGRLDLNHFRGRTAAWILEHSPSERVERLRGPVLIFTGDKDGPDSVGMTEPFVDRARSSGKLVTWVRFPSEGHGVERPENATALDWIERRFLAGCLGGPAPVDGSVIAAADLIVMTGPSNVPGLVESLRAPSSGD